jgi:hypothetical protein
MKRLLGVCLLSASFAWLPAGAYARNCPTTFNPSSFTKGNFFSNFNNSCYLIPFSTGNGSGGEQGDLNSVYNKLYFNINSAIPPYELIIVGEFPNARYFSVGIYDNHSAATQNLSDVDIVPLTSSDVNPFLPGASFVNGQHYALPINLGGTPGTLEPGCVMTGYNVDVNAMDGTQRHAFMNWNLDPAFFRANPTMPLHEIDTPTHANPNLAGTILIRSYLDLTVPSTASQPHVIVRDVASGCAYPASVVNTMNVVTIVSATGNAWLNQKQVQEHNVYANWQATECWGIIPSSQMQWLRGDEYTPGSNPDSSYLTAYVPSGLPQTLATAGEVMRLRFQVPTTPPTPCVNGCFRDGSEQMRYLSVSFQIPGGGTLASIPDSCPLNPLSPCTPFVQDANGYVTLIVGTGATPPSWVTPANGYTWLDLTAIANYQTLNQIAIRNILPATSFDCSAQLIPYKVGEATLAGAGLMGLYAPVIDYPVASSLPTTATPITGPNSCAVFPVGPPTVTPKCAVQIPKGPQIAAVTTQCSLPGCSQVVVQPQPPISIVATAGGFGSFPFGLPYTGNSDFIEITDSNPSSHQSWSAGFTGDACTVQIGEWSDTLISLVANVNQNGNCPMAAGDPLTVTVWNPQTHQSASLTVTVAAPSSNRRH